MSDDQVLAVIVLYQDDHGFSPTVREIGDYLNLAPSTVLAALVRLEEAGRISRLGSSPRTIRVLG